MPVANFHCFYYHINIRRKNISSLSTHNSYNRGLQSLGGHDLISNLKTLSEHSLQKTAQAHTKI